MLQAFQSAHSVVANSKEECRVTCLETRDYDKCPFLVLRRILKAACLQTRGYESYPSMLSMLYWRNLFFERDCSAYAFLNMDLENANRYDDNRFLPCANSFQFVLVHFQFIDNMLFRQRLAVHGTGLVQTHQFHTAFPAHCVFREVEGDTEKLLVFRHVAIRSVHQCYVTTIPKCSFSCNHR